jgi:hypothetical protein
MPSKRRKGQSIDFYAGALKSIMKNKEGYSQGQLSIMLEAAKLLALLDSIPTGLTGDSGQSTPIGPDPLLESLKARQAATLTIGVTNAAS